jgi:hypothetical protein
MRVIWFRGNAAEARNIIAHAEANEAACAASQRAPGQKDSGRLNRVSAASADRRTKKTPHPFPTSADSRTHDSTLTDEN